MSSDGVPAAAAIMAIAMLKPLRAIHDKTAEVEYAQRAFSIREAPGSTTRR